MNDNYSEIAKNLGLKDINTDNAIDLLKHDILMSLYRKPNNLKNNLSDIDKKLNKKIKKVYMGWYGTKFVDSHITPMFLVSLPGHGKTISFKIAAEIVAKSLDLNFITNIDNNYIPSNSDFLFLVADCSKSIENKKTLSYPFNKGENNYIENVAGSLLLLDDISKDNDEIQREVLLTLNEKQFKGVDLNNTYIGLAGNTNKFENIHLSKSIMGRTIPVFTYCTLNRFIAQILSNYNDSIGDTGVIGFLNKYPECFKSPSQLEKFIEANRNLIKKNNNKNVERNIISEFEEVKKSAIEILGFDVGNKFNLYYFDLQNVKRESHRIMIEGKININKIKSIYGAGIKKKQTNFSYQMLFSCVDYLVDLIRDGKTDEIYQNLNKGLDRFSNFMCLLKYPEFGHESYLVSSYLKNKLAYQIDDFSIKISESMPYRKVLFSKVENIIVQNFFSSDKFSKSQKMDLIDMYMTHHSHDWKGRSKRESLEEANINKKIKHYSLLKNIPLLPRYDIDDALNISNKILDDATLDEKIKHYNLIKNIPNTGRRKL